MDRALSTHLFVGQRLTVATLRQIERAGIGTIEIFCARQHFDYSNSEQVHEVAAWIRDHHLRVRSVHAPLYRDYSWGRSGDHSEVNIAEPERFRRIQSADEIKRVLDLTEAIPFRYLVQHLGLPGEEWSQKKSDAAYSSLEPLVLFAKQRGVQILLENIPNELSTPARLRMFIEETRLADLGICFDSGHAHLMGGVEADFDIVRELVKSVHVHDNRGETDDHLFPFQGTIDWKGALATLTAGGDRFPLQLEIRDHGEFADPVAKAIETLDRLEKLTLAKDPKTP